MHYIHFKFRPNQVELFRTDPVVLAVDHPAYGHETGLTPTTSLSSGATLPAEPYLRCL